MKVPRLMHSIWVGPHPAPLRWLGTWKAHHPEWEHRLWTNADLSGWRNQRHIDFYKSLRKWNGVADLMRYEILYRYGGIVVAADSECLRPIDELFEDGKDLYTIDTSGLYDNRVTKKTEGSTTPLYAAAPGHEFTSALIEALYSVKKLTKNPPFSTGNRFMQRMLKRKSPDIVRWPMHYFIPRHFNGWKYEGPDKPFAVHYWGTTRNTYHLGR